MSNEYKILRMDYWTILASLEHMGLAYILAAVRLSTAGYPFAQFVKNTMPTFWYFRGKCSFGLI